MIEHYEVAERRAELGTLGPWTLDGLVADVHRHAAAGRWLWATMAICLVQELLFCVDDGGVEMSRHLSGDFADEVRTLRYLRNVIAHPAKMPVKTGENSADEFCFRMERELAFYELAPSLLDNWSLFADHRVTRFALRRLNTPAAPTAASSAYCRSVQGSTIDRRPHRKIRPGVGGRDRERSTAPAQPRAARAAGRTGAATVGECLHRSPRRLRPRRHRPGHAVYISAHLPRTFRTKKRPSPRRTAVIFDVTG